jgi:type I restriction enzyme S subunit
MALCDQLEQQQTDSLQAHQTLVETLLRTLVDAGDDVHDCMDAGDRAMSEMIAEDAQVPPQAGMLGAAAESTQQAWNRIAEHFDTLFTTEASIDQLKKTILQFAVMGRLVPQDPNDEPARSLLAKVAEEKTTLLRERKIKKQKAMPNIAKDEKLFALPIGWAWVRLSELSLHSEAGWSPKCNAFPREGESWGVLKVSSVTWGEFNAAENKSLPQGMEPRKEYEVKSGDFLISRANTSELVARSVVVPEGVPKHLIMSDKIIRFVFSSGVERKYLNLVNGSPVSRSYYARIAGGTSSSMKNVSRDHIRRLVLALPPLAEQHRIVAKVAELMALCDALKSSIQDAQAIQVHLADAVVDQAVA